MMEAEINGVPVGAETSLQKTLRSDVIRRFYTRSDWEGTKQALFQFFLILITGCLMKMFENIPLFWSLALLCHSFVLSFLFMGLHENVHGTAFRSDKLSKLFRNIFGFLTFRPPIHYYYYHWAHHKHTGNPEKDPELFNSFIDMKIDGVLSYLMYLSGIPFWIDRFTTIIRHCFGIFYFQDYELEYYFHSSNSRQRCQTEAIKYIASYCSLTLVGWLYPAFGHVLFFYWLLPSILGQPHLRLYLLAEHQGCLSDSAEIFDNTRNTDSVWMYKKMAWFMPYHATHHAWPGVPFHRLHEVSSLIEGRSRDSKCKPPGENGYLLFNYNFLRSFDK